MEPNQTQNTINQTSVPGTGSSPQTITSSLLAPAPIVDIPTSPVPTTLPATQNVPQQFLDATQVEDTQTQKDARGISELMYSVLPQLSGQTEALVDAQANAGLPKLKQELQGINSQILKKQAEIAQDDIQLIAGMRAEERRDTLLPFAQQGQAKIAGDAAIMRALKNSEIGVLNSTALAKQGDIALAMETAQQAVDVKYAPFRDIINTGMAQLKALEPILSADEKKQARAQEIKGKFALKEIEKAEEEEKTITALGMQIAPYAPDGVRIAVMKSKSLVEAINAAGKYIADPLDRAIKSATLEEKQQNIKKLRKEISDTGTTITNPYPIGSSNHTLAKIINSASNKSDLTVGEREQLSKMKLVVQQLDTLEESISSSKGATGVISGRARKILGNLGVDADAGYINAQLTALVPNVARGIYGEVGVLTKDDVELYKKTLPRVEANGSQNDLLLAMTLKNASLSYENILTSASNSNVNVSGWAEDYQAIQDQLASVEDRIGLPAVKIEDFTAKNPDYANAIAEMYENNFTDREILNLLGIN